MKHLEHIPLKEKREILIQLKKYAEIRKKIWKRAKNIFFQKDGEREVLQVEIANIEFQERVFEIICNIAYTLFGIPFEKNRIFFRENPDLGWGMRMYYKDYICDISFFSLYKEYMKQAL